MVRSILIAVLLSGCASQVTGEELFTETDERGSAGVGSVVAGEAGTTPVDDVSAGATDSSTGGDSGQAGTPAISEETGGTAGRPVVGAGGSSGGESTGGQSIAGDGGSVSVGQSGGSSVAGAGTAGMGGTGGQGGVAGMATGGTDTEPEPEPEPEIETCLMDGVGNDFGKQFDCHEYSRGTSYCHEGECISCGAHRLDCDGDPSNSCESYAWGADTCGFCDKSCYTPQYWREEKPDDYDPNRHRCVDKSGGYGCF